MSKNSQQIYKNGLVVIASLIFFVVFINTTVSMLMATYVRYQITVAPKYQVYLYYGPALLLKNFHQLAFFTNQTNIIFTIATLLLALWPKNQRVINFFFFAVTLLLIVFILFGALLSGVGPGGQVLGMDYFYLMTHGIFPIIGFIMLYVLKNKIKVTIISIFYSIIYLQLYYFFLLAMHVAANVKYGVAVAVYPFAQFARPFFYLGGNLVIISVINIVAFLIFSALPIPIILLYRFIYKLKSEKLIKEFKQLFQTKKIIF